MNKISGSSTISDVTFDYSTFSSPRKRKKEEEKSSLDVKKKKSVNFTEASLGPHGHYKRRLDRSLNHLPLKTTPKSRWALHRWAGVETQKQVMYCEACNTSLCILCYQHFHFDPNLHKKRSVLEKTFAVK